MLARFIHRTLFRAILHCILPGLLLCGLAMRVLALSVTFDTNTPPANLLIDVGNTQYEEYDVTVSGVTVTINGAHSFASLTVQSNGVVTHSPGLVGGMNLNVSGNVTINSGCAINLNLAGYGATQGPGAGNNGSSASDTRGSGGSYGGNGGYGYRGVPPTNSYGSVAQPTDLGSGGGDGQSGTTFGGAGGGALKLYVGGTLTVSGSISTNGGDSNNRAGGGSGGSLWIAAQTLTGQGTITANGGIGYDYGGGGSGGRIALYYTDKTNFNSGSSLIAYGGGSANQNGGAGTIYTKQNSATQGDLIIDNGGASGNITPLSSDLTVANFTLQGRAIVTPAGGPLPEGGILRLTAQNVTLANYGRITTQGYGYPAAQGPGAGMNGLSSNDTRGSGGSYGGNGGGGYNGTPSVNAYGSIAQPTDLGSGGGDGLSGAAIGGTGGGAIKLTIGGALNIAQYCSIDANGNNSDNNAGGGSGGSLWITAQTLTGQGTITANGGIGYNYGGGGGGGRIALYYNDKSGFFGSILAQGGASGTQSGGAGTLYLLPTGATMGDLIIDNGGQSGQFTPLLGLNNLNTLTVKGRGILSPPGDSFPAGATLTLTTQGDITVAQDGRISAQYYGYPSAQGPGAGTNAVNLDTNNYRGGGAGYGGAGGAGYGNVPGGGTYGSATLPTDLGSGGGTGYLGAALGGSGGGAVRLIVNGALHLSGFIDANGVASANRAGGGSGGSVWITTLAIDGPGAITANGGTGNDYGGGGGGGRVALYYTDKTNFSGILQASGGISNSQYGADGTTNTFLFNSAYSLAGLNITPSTVAGGQTVTGIITISGTVPAGGLSVALKSSDPIGAAVPSNVTVLEGQNTASFTINTVSHSSAYNVTITASLGGITQTATLTITPLLSTMQLALPSVIGGVTTSGTLTLSVPAPAGGITVHLASSDPSVTFSNGGTLTFAAGTTQQAFAIITSAVTAAKSATITATYGAESLSRTLYINPAGAQLASVSVAPGSVVGGATATGVVTLTKAAPSGGALVALVSSDITTATVVASVLVPAGQTSASFSITTKPVATSKSVLINATLGVTKTTTLTVRLPGVVSLTLLPNTVNGGDNSVGIVTLDGVVSVPTTVTVTSNLAQAVPTASFVIPAGQTTGSFVISTSNVAAPMTALITARANGLAKSQGLTINPGAPGTSTISGTVTLDGCLNSVQGITFVFRPSGGGTNLTRTATLGADGSFTLSALPAGNYDLWIKGAKWLAKVIPVNATGGNVTGVSALLEPGDADNNNIVDIGDFGILVNSYLGVASDPTSGYDARADFNCDNIVDIGDFGLLVNNYGSLGDP